MKACCDPGTLEWFTGGLLFNPTTFYKNKNKKTSLGKVK